MSLSSLVALLDSNPLARRVDQSEDIWDVSCGWSSRDAADRLLAEVMSVLLASRRPCFLASGFPIDSKDLGAEPWLAVTDTLWRVRADLDPARFIASSVHNEGDYALYACATEEHVARIPDGLPWWGSHEPRVRAARLGEGLRQAGIEVAVAVHPDASDWTLILPGARRNGPSRRA